MEFLGEFLSPQNNIAKDQDQLTKYFYFRPDKYDNPDADVENIFIIKGMTEFPKRYDALAENADYAVDSISVSKRISDEQAGVTDVSYVVTATYDLLDNIKKREASSPASEEEDEEGDVNVDEDGNKATGSTLPWKERAQWSFQPIEVVIPFKYAYANNARVVNVVNAAKCVLFAETKRYQLEITYTKNYQYSQSWEGITQAMVNSTDFNLTFDYRGAFKAGTLLILPPTYSRNWVEVPDEKDPNKTVLKDYYTYTVKMIHDPEGHTKKLLNVGTYALFGEDPVPRQIWEVTKVDSDTGNIMNGYPKWVSAATALQEQAKALQAGQQVNASPVSEPVPLTIAGRIDELALKDPTNHKYTELVFEQYPSYNFGNLPFKN